MPKSSESINISGEDEEKLRTCANNNARAVRQTQETRQGHVSSLSLFLRNNQQDDKDHSGTNKFKTIINQQC